MAPKRESSIKKSPSPVSQTRLGPPFPCLPAAPTAPKPAPEQKPRMLRPSDSPFDPSTLEVSAKLQNTFCDKANVQHSYSMFCQLIFVSNIVFNNQKRKPIQNSNLLSDVN